MASAESGEFAAFRSESLVTRWWGLRECHELTRFWLLRLLGFVYVAAFGSLAVQVIPLLGAHGFSPAFEYVTGLLDAYGSPWRAMRAEPTLFWFLAPADLALVTTSALGLGLSCAVMLGVTNAAVMLVLWVLYRSFLGIDQLWYGYGWELLLAETGFLAIFLCPFDSWSPRRVRRVSPIVIVLLRWLALRVMLGAGLIKLRGDACWWDLTCLDYHFETQPLPNPLSPLFHFLPHGVHAGGVLFNHVCELVCPFLIFGPRSVRRPAALAMMAFQGILIASGNLSFLNWLTLVPLLACLDDRALARVSPAWVVRATAQPRSGSRWQRPLCVALALGVAVLSVEPTLNLLSPKQRMNGAFEPLHLVNTYGAFGSVGRERFELVFEGTRDPMIGPETRWEAYEFPCKPGDPARRPCVISPFQPRLDWQVWFAAMGTPADAPWTLLLVWKLLHADPSARRLLARDPFSPEAPRYVRVKRYRYRFARLSSRAWWTRSQAGTYLPPLAASDPRLRQALLESGFRFAVP